MASHITSTNRSANAHPVRPGGASRTARPQENTSARRPQAPARDRSSVSAEARERGGEQRANALNSALTSAWGPSSWLAAASQSQPAEQSSPRASELANTAKETTDAAQRGAAAARATTSNASTRALARNLGRRAGILGPIFEVASAAARLQEIQNDPNLTPQQRSQQSTRVVVGTSGSVGGGAAGGVIGAAICAPLGPLAMFGCGLLGSWLGGEGGRAVGEAAVDSAYRERGTVSEYVDQAVAETYPSMAPYITNQRYGE